MAVIKENMSGVILVIPFRKINVLMIQIGFAFRAFRFCPV
jgi:hypothetical protein